jgi:hypothetical protein
MFNKVHTVVCPVCLPAEDQDAEAVRESLEENPNLNAEQVAEMTGVNIQVVLRLIDQGAIACATELEGHVVRCGRCGAPAISASKRLCQACLEKLNTQVAIAQRNIHLGERKQVEVAQYHQNVRHALDQRRQKD